MVHLLFPKKSRDLFEPSFLLSFQPQLGIEEMRGNRKCPPDSLLHREKRSRRLVKYRVGEGAVNQGKPGDSRGFPSSTPEDKCHGDGGGVERGREREREREDAWPLLVAVNQGFGDIKRPLIRENTRFISAERRRDRQEIGVYTGGQSMGRGNGTNTG